MTSGPLVVLSTAPSTEEGASIGRRLVEERLRGAKSPDWYLVTDVPHLLDGEYRHSYVMWHEQRSPSASAKS